MAIVAIVHLHVVDVPFVLQSSGRTSQIQLLLEQKQKQCQNGVESSREVATLPPQTPSCAQPKVNTKGCALRPDAVTTAS